MFLCAAISSLAPWIAAFYNDPRLVPLTVAVSTSFLWGGLTVQHEALLARQMKLSRSVLARLSATILSAVLAVVLALAGYGYWALVWQEVSRSFLVAAGVWLLCPWRPGLPSRQEDVRSLLRFGTELTLAQFFFAVVSNVDRVLVGRLFGAGVLGIYRQAHTLIMVPIEQLNGPINSVSQPGLSMLQNEPGRYRRYYQKVLWMVAVTTMPIAAFACRIRRRDRRRVPGEQLEGRGTAVPNFRAVGVHSAGPGDRWNGRPDLPVVRQDCWR